MAGRVRIVGAGGDAAGRDVLGCAQCVDLAGSADGGRVPAIAFWTRGHDRLRALEPAAQQERASEAGNAAPRIDSGVDDLYADGGTGGQAVDRDREEEHGTGSC